MTLGDLADAWNVEFDEMIRLYPSTAHIDAAEWSIDPAFERAGEWSGEAELWLRDYISDRIHGFLP